jgi:hypothetical protein
VAWIKERRKLNRFCEECRRIFSENPKFKGKEPKCNECFPGVRMENIETWEVFQRYASPMGTDSGVVLDLAKACGVRDELEVLEKVLYILGEMEKDG